MGKQRVKGRAGLIYKNENLRAVSFPLGGIGTGQVALCGDGGLRQWQIFNNINHQAHMPMSFFSIHVNPRKGRAFGRVLQSNKWYDFDTEPAPSISDHVVPEASRELLNELPGIEDLTFIGKYPTAEIAYSLPEMPINLTLRAYSPFIPLEAKDSGLPAIIFHFKLENPTDEQVDASILMTQQNAVGWDDSGAISGVSHPSYGGNRNRRINLPGLTAVEMANPSLPEGHPFKGQMVAAALSEAASTRMQWTNLKDVWNEFSASGNLTDSKSNRPSPKGKTVNAAIACPVTLAPESEANVTFLLTWYFPNRYVDWEQPTLEQDEDIKKSNLWIGVGYASRHNSALAVTECVRDNLDRFDDIATKFEKAMHDSSLPAPIIEAVSTQISVLRSPTCFRAADGRFYGFEGCCGASTELNEQDKGGCCPLNCTHVWNYAQTMSRLFPELERSMRETEWLHQQHESGYLPHRVVVPLSLRQPWDKCIGGPDYPAIDGLLGGILKTYREFLVCGDTEWLASLWDHVRLALEHAMNRYDRGDGLIHGPQPCTYDVTLEGPNSFIQSLYLASLRAGEEMAKVLGKTESAREYRDRFKLGKGTADKLLWDGDYYIHLYDPETEFLQAYGRGCHSDQLFGQWWSHYLGLGHVLSKSRVKRALSSVAKHNFKEDFANNFQFPRRYVLDSEPGTINCTWPKGDRPDTALLYSDEVWTGMEYEVAGLLIFEGMIDEALKILGAARKRHDGRLRSPWNEVECGDHYVRAMSSWALLEAASGFRHDASKETIEFGPRISPENFKSFFITATGWGQYSQKIKRDQTTARLSVSWGTVRVRELRLAGVSPKKVTAKIGSKTIPLAASKKADKIKIRFKESLLIKEGSSLRVNIG